MQKFSPIVLQLLMTTPPKSSNRVSRASFISHTPQQASKLLLVRLRFAYKLSPTAGDDHRDVCGCRTYERHEINSC